MPVRILIEVYHIRQELPFDVEQPRSRSFDILPGFVHPLELVRTLEHIYVRKCLEDGTLFRTERSPHGCQRYSDTMRGKRETQFGSVGPYATYGVRGHEDAHGSM